MAPTSPFTELRHRLEPVEEHGRELQSDGMPFPSIQIRDMFEAAVRSGSVEDATAIVKRAEMLLARAARDWVWVRELLQRVDELRSIAETIGVDLALVDSRVGNPREQLMSEPLSVGSLQKTAAGATLALAVLSDAVPKFCVHEAEALGVSIRRARDRGEEVADAVASFSRLLRSLQEDDLPLAAERLSETRRVVARIPRAPAIPTLSTEEEDEILLEARNLARHLHRIKGRARDATTAARLMTQVRHALSEERRTGSPEEEIEALWSEVDRLTREKKLAGAGPALAGAARPGEEEPGAEGEAYDDLGEEAGEAGAVPEPRPTLTVEEEPAPLPPEPEVPPVVEPAPAEAGPPAPRTPEEIAEARSSARVAFYAAYVPPDPAPHREEREEREESTTPGGAPVRRGRSRHRQDAR
ncbi:MAG TPA: hypothetical protein VK455_03775 [Thermoplasmata archaeon]|nr:hypothetical protein [Thermoplasmata archaeon]